MPTLSHQLLFTIRHTPLPIVLVRDQEELSHLDDVVQTCLNEAVAVASDWSVAVPLKLNLRPEVIELKLQKLDTGKKLARRILHKEQCVSPSSACSGCTFVYLSAVASDCVLCSYPGSHSTKHLVSLVFKIVFGEYIVNQ